MVSDHPDSQARMRMLLKHVRRFDQEQQERQKGQTVTDGAAKRPASCQPVPTAALQKCTTPRCD